jgi:hypothetical protein
LRVGRPRIRTASAVFQLILKTSDTKTT